MNSVCHMYHKYANCNDYSLCYICTKYLLDVEFYVISIAGSSKDNTAKLLQTLFQVEVEEIVTVATKTKDLQKKYVMS